MHRIATQLCHYFSAVRLQRIDEAFIGYNMFVTAAVEVNVGSGKSINGRWHYFAEDLFG